MKELASVPWSASGRAKIVPQPPDPLPGLPPHAHGPQSPATAQALRLALRPWKPQPLAIPNLISDLQMSSLQTVTDMGVIPPALTLSVMLVITPEPIRTSTALYTSEVYLVGVYFFLSKLLSNAFGKHCTHGAAKRYVNIFFPEDKSYLGKNKKSEICSKSRYKRTVVYVDRSPHLSRPQFPLLLDER